ncbi:MAG: GNAT family N-acetyltransferase [Alphaproteobacteria bacterium]|nr:GNAT family N-acetyltransferase [Alphaproteobacteria bacterium]
MSVRIRPFAAADAAGLRALILPIQRDEFAVAITWEQQPDLHDVDAFYRGGAGEFWVAESAGAVVGSVALKDIGGGLGALRKMFVRADHRGHAAGVAQRLLDTLVAHARARGIAAIVLGTTAQFLAAHRFYEKNGFRAIPPEALPASFPRMAVDTRFYRRDL